jgi:hypothetical protein
MRLISMVRRARKPRLIVTGGSHAWAEEVVIKMAYVG